MRDSFSFGGSKDGKQLHVDGYIGMVGHFTAYSDPVAFLVAMPRQNLYRRCFSVGSRRKEKNREATYKGQPAMSHAIARLFPVIPRPLLLLLRHDLVQDLVVRRLGDDLYRHELIFSLVGQPSLNSHP